MNYLLSQLERGHQHKRMALNKLDLSGYLDFHDPGFGFRNGVFPTAVDGSLEGNKGPPQQKRALHGLK